MNNKFSLSGNTKYNPMYTFVIFLILMLPLKGYTSFFIITSFILIIVSIRSGNNINRYTKVLFIVIVYLSLGALIRFFITFTPNLRDFVEIGRFIPVFLIFFYYSYWRELKNTNIIDALFGYVLVDTFISYIQINQLNIFNLIYIVKDLYNSTNQFEISLLISSRSIGLSSGPGQHASIMFVCFIIFLVSFLLNKKRKFITLIGVVLSLYCILTSQSRTVFIAAVLIFIVSLVYVILKDKSKGSSIFLLVLLSTVFPVIIQFIEKQNYLSTVFTGIFNNSSYNARENKWDEIFNAISMKPEWLFFGYGKDYFGSVSGAMDSDYIYILSVYGLVFFLTFIIYVAFMIIKYTMNWKNNNNAEKTLLLLIIGGLIVSWPASFFIDPKIMIILAFMIVVSQKRTYEERGGF